MSIYAKLLEFQKLGISIRKDKKNPHFKSNYADINEVLDKVKPELSKMGVVVIQKPHAFNSIESTQFGLQTILHDIESKTEVESFLPFIGATDPQKLGSNLTYLRRYSLVAMLGLEDDDDDGNQASTKTAAPAMNAEIALGRLYTAQSLSELQTIWKAIPNGIQKDPEVLAMKEQRKTELTNQSA